MPVQGQGLVAFLERCCRQDNGIFQLRAVFDLPGRDGVVPIRVVFPGTATFAAGQSELPPMISEHFELKETTKVGELKKMIETRTRFPANRGVLLLGVHRLHDEVPARVFAAGEDAGTPLQFHLASSGAYVFLRREGQGHREPFGPYCLTLLLPECVQGSRMRPMKFDLQQRLGDLRWSVQAVSGLPPAGMQLALASPVARSFCSSDGSETLEALGFSDGCTLKVEYNLLEASMLGDAFDMPMEMPTAGSAAELYETAAAKLGIADSSSLTLFAGNCAINRDADLSCAPLADGTVLSAYMAWSLQLSISVLIHKASATASASNSGSSGSTDGAGIAASGVTTSSTSSGAEVQALQPLACLSSDTIAEVRERAVGVAAAARSEVAGRLRGSKVFAVSCSSWQASASDCTSLALLARLLGHFTPCMDGARLSRLGISEGVHLVFVPEHQLHVEIEVRISGETSVVRKLRVPSTSRLFELSRLLEQDLRAQPIKDRPTIENLHCQWSLCPSHGGVAPVAADRTDAASTATAPTARGVAGIVGSAASVVAKGKRRISGRFSSEDTAAKKRRLEALVDVADEEFVGDLHAQHPAGRQELPSYFLCPISYDVMRDPVIVSGSGNTYDRKSIEQHFQHRHTDPLTNVEYRLRSDRRLIPNNWLRSQINEVERDQVDLRLIASLGERRRGVGPKMADGSSGSGDGSMASSLRWCASLLLGSGSDKQA